MTVKEFLSRAIQLDAQIASLIAARDNYRRLAENIGGARLEEHVSHSAANEAPYARLVEKIADKEREIAAKIERLVEVKFSINGFIDGIENPKWQRLLRSRYVMCLPWSEVAEEMGCGLSSVYRIHNQILKNLKNESV